MHDLHTINELNVEAEEKALAKKLEKFELVALTTAHNLGLPLKEAKSFASQVAADLEAAVTKAETAATA